MKPLVDRRYICTSAGWGGRNGRLVARLWVRTVIAQSSYDVLYCFRARLHVCLLFPTVFLFVFLSVCEDYGGIRDG